MSARAWTGPDASDADWDLLVAGLDGASIFQCAAWAEHRRDAGWASERWSADAGGITAAVQLLVRHLPGVVLIWAPGGPIIAPTDPDARTVADLVGDLFAQLQERHGTVYLRVDPPSPPGSAAAAALAARCRRPRNPLNTGATVLLPLSRDASELLAAMSKHHRYEVRRGLSQDIVWRSGHGKAEVGALVDLHAQMTRRKRIKTAPQAQHAAIFSLCRAFGERAIILIGSKAGTPVTACLALTFADGAFFHTAATGDGGLGAGASYAAVHTLALLLAERGVRTLDLGGMDERGAMLGVARFKKGFGGRIAVRTGEWHWSSRPGAARLVDVAVGMRRGALGA